MEQNRSEYRIARIAQWFQVSKSGYYAWRRRCKSPKAQESEVLLNEIWRIHDGSHGAYGTMKICRKLNETFAAPVNHKRVERIMHENGIRSKTHRKYKATTNSRYNLPIAENILNRNLTVEVPGQKIVGISMGSRMSRKSNCWDNTAMESFWDKLKQEWLDERHFHTREEAKAAVFEYIFIFHNRIRIHEANGYQTPEAYYRTHQKDSKVA